MSISIEPILIIAAFVVSITIHEFSHALAATVLGDDTARKSGRLTLNPFAHIDPLGLFFLILIKFGWAKPVPFNPKNFMYPKLYSILVALAGPTSNLILAFISLVILHYIPTYTALASFLKISAWINVMLGVFNLIPIPPLDGSHFITVFLPQRLLVIYQKLQPFFIIALIILIAIPFFKNALLLAILRILTLINVVATSF